VVVPTAGQEVLLADIFETRAEADVARAVLAPWSHAQLALAPTSSATPTERKRVAAGVMGVLLGVWGNRGETASR
jgi:hypothetical protein